MKKAFIFDLDGTVADTLNGITHFVNRATAAFGLSSLSKEKIRYYVGDGAVKLIERTLADVGGADRFDEIYAYYNRLYNADPYYALRAFDGIIETMDSLKAKGIRIAVLSNKPHAAVAPICQRLFGDRVDYVQGQMDGIPTKPDQAGVKMVWKALHVTAEDCVYVGDTNVDMLTGKGGNMLTVGVLWGFRDEQELRDNEADYIVSKPEELLSFIE